MICTGGVAVASLGGVIAYFGVREYQRAAAKPLKIWQLITVLLGLLIVVGFAVLGVAFAIGRLWAH